MTAPSRIWTIRSRREKTVVRDLLPDARANKARPLRVLVQGIDADASTFRGLRLGLKNPTTENLLVTLYWGPKGLGSKPSTGRMFKEQPIVVSAESSVTIDLPLPARNPLTSDPWVLGALEIRFASKGFTEGQRVVDLIDTLALFSDPLLSD